MSTLVAVCGNIGSGKTTLCRSLATYENVELIEENVEGNPFLGRFYQDMPTWALRSQLKFLIDRHRSAMLPREAGIILEDRSIQEDVFVFAATLFQEGILNDEDWTLYREIAETVLSAHRRPRLIVYLRAPVETMLRRIIIRGREIEKDIEIRYLQQLQYRYDSLIADFRAHSDVWEIDTVEMDVRESDTVRSIHQQLMERIS